jgi:type I restriction enzyme R subunit
MPPTVRSERMTQNRIIRLFCPDQRHPQGTFTLKEPTAPYNPSTLTSLGYRYLGNWEKRQGNRNIETELLTQNLQSRGYSPAQISAVLQKLIATADTTGKTLYQANLQTYQLLRYGVPVQTAVGQTHETVHLIDWENPTANDFAIAEEVTLKSGYERRPDLVIYLNGIAIGVIELKRGSVEVGDGIRQLITNQEEIFNKNFFSTVQFLFAGNDTQGLYYGTVGTPAEFFVPWKLQTANSNTSNLLLDRSLAEMCDQERLLDLIRNCIIFDGGQKKSTPSPSVRWTKSRSRKNSSSRRWCNLAHPRKR